MNFGLESEKLLFNLTKNRPSEGVFRIIDALSDYNSIFGKDITARVSNEFVLNMIEIGTSPSPEPMEVIKDYLLTLMLVQTISNREDVALVPLGSLPMDYLPHILPKWPYYVQNSILDHKKQESWNMEHLSPLRAAGNCAGIHVHVELETAPEFLFMNRELQDKFNMGLCLSPMIAFSSSPYFFDKHEATSMRGMSYYHGVYAKEKLNGGLPPVMGSSEEVLRYFDKGINAWIERGMALGFPKDNLLELTRKKGANWNPVRWNRAWNTIEIRCLDSDRMDLDSAKFVLATAAMSRMDLQGEKLQCEPLKTTKNSLDANLIDQCFEVTGMKVSILPSELLMELFDRSMKSGLRDPLVARYLRKLQDFAQEKAPEHLAWAFTLLDGILESQMTTSEVILSFTNGSRKLTATQAIDVVHLAIDEQKKNLPAFQALFPEVFARLDASDPRQMLHS
ncbi:MAG TPA: hypothetical protein VNJ01_18010 [Bacteriovoracaceae bacterium]|nr:hypothetical protein [Bacteriovoracaceae bacterium]